MCIKWSEILKSSQFWTDSIFKKFKHWKLNHLGNWHEASIVQSFRLYNSNSKREKFHCITNISFELIGCDISCDSQSEYRFSIWDELNIHQILKAHQLSSEEVLKETLRQHFFLGFKLKTCLKIFNFEWFSKNCPVSQLFVMSSNMQKECCIKEIDLRKNFLSRRNLKSTLSWFLD